MKFLIIFLIASTVVSAQETGSKKNIIYIELLGNGLFSSLNYEHEISRDLNYRIGLGYYFSSSASNSGSHFDFGFFPIAMLNYFIRINDNNYFEIGGGTIISYSDLSSWVSYESTIRFVPTFAIGYRYSPKDGGFFFSAAFDMFTLGRILPWGGLGLGVRF